MKKIGENTLGSQDMLEAFNKLQEYIASGYLLHGSKNKLDVLEPRQAVDGDKTSKVTNLNGVYATDDIRISIFMALFAKKDISKNGWRSFYSVTSKDEITVGGENVFFTDGFVHVLSREKFKEIEDENGKEIVASEPVTPIDVIKITPDILKYLSGVTYEMGDDVGV
jgi:hypothetical protein